MSALPLLGWGGLLALTAIIACVFLAWSRWRWPKRIFAALLALGIGLGIPFWDYLPAKMYFREACKDAGTYVLTNKKYHDVFEQLRQGRSTGAVTLEWHVDRFESYLVDAATNETVAVMRSYRLTDGSHGFLKPWLFSECRGNTETTAIRNPDPNIHPYRYSGDRLTSISLALKNALEGNTETTK